MTKNNNKIIIIIIPATKLLHFGLETPLPPSGDVCSVSLPRRKEFRFRRATSAVHFLRPEIVYHADLVGQEGEGEAQREMHNSITYNKPDYYNPVHNLSRNLPLPRHLEFGRSVARCQDPAYPSSASCVPRISRPLCAKPSYELSWDLAFA